MNQIIKNQILAIRESGEKMCIRDSFNSCLFPWEDVNKYSEFRKAVEKYVDREDKN